MNKQLRDSNILEQSSTLPAPGVANGEVTIELRRLFMKDAAKA